MKGMTAWSDCVVHDSDSGKHKDRTSMLRLPANQKICCKCLPAKRHQPPHHAALLLELANR
jgi:hypothetical protein